MTTMNITKANPNDRPNDGYEHLLECIQAYSRQGKLEGYEEADACGIFIQEGSKHPYKMRVTTDTGVLDYQIDRWD